MIFVKLEFSEKLLIWFSVKKIEQHHKARLYDGGQLQLLFTTETS